jgi:hypothetical protein
VYIIYDIDAAGRTGAVKAAKAISCAARSVHIVELPLDGIPKGDLTDAYMRAPEHFVDFINHLMENTDQYQPPEVVSRVTVPPEVHRTYLENIVKDKLFYKRVNLKARIVNNAQHETTIVPKVAFISCNKDYKEHICQACPIHYREDGLTLFVRPEYPELMSMVGNNVKVQKAAMQSMAGVVEACTKVKIEQKEHQALYPIVIIPAIEADKKQHNYSMVTAWALDVPSQENEDYDVEGVVLANPETQKMELVCYRMDKDTTSLDSFELTEQMIERLGVFQCTDQASNK